LFLAGECDSFRTRSLGEASGGIIGEIVSRVLIGIGLINDVIFDSASIHPALPQRSRDSYRSGRAPP
jgi:hypothetical protein